ncbi:MAG: RES domain-containing protein [Rhizobacter sp.]|nr:RES domain-containing protein [Rhizobacter sp.]
MLAPLGPAGVVVWRLDDERRASTWDSGIGGEMFGGRWNAKGTKAVYCSLDPATCLVESAVHKGFAVLASQPPVLSSAVILDPRKCHVVWPEDVPNAGWLHSGIVSGGQQAFGSELLGRHAFVLFPSVVSCRSWNLVFDPGRAVRAYRLRTQERLSLDTRLHPPPR